MDAVAGARRSVPSNVLGLRFIKSRRRGVVEAVCRGSGKILVRSHGFLSNWCKVFVARCGVLLPAVAAAANSAIPTLRCHSVSAVAAQFQVSLCKAWKNSVEWCTPWEIFRNSQGKVGIEQEAVSVRGRTRKLLGWAGELQVGFLADPAAPE